MRLQGSSCCFNASTKLKVHSTTFTLPHNVPHIMQSTITVALSLVSIWKVSDAAHCNMIPEGSKYIDILGKTRVTQRPYAAGI